MPTTQLLHQAYWSSPISGIVAFHEDWLEEEDPKLIWGETGEPLLDLEREPALSFGRHSGYCREGSSIRFILQPEIYELEMEALRAGEDASGPAASAEGGRALTYSVVGPFNGWGAAEGGKEDASWRLREVEINGEPFLSTLVPLELVFGETEVTYFKFLRSDGRWVPVPDDAPNAFFDPHGNRNLRLRRKRTGFHLYRFRPPIPLNLTREWDILLAHPKGAEIVPLLPGVFLSRLHSSLELGATFLDGKTIFRIFAPRATEVELYIYEDRQAELPDPVAMHHVDGMVWEATMEGNLHGWYYHFQIDGGDLPGYGQFNREMRILDPYARACVGPLGPGIVIDRSRIRPPSSRYHPQHWHDLVVMEAHVRDLTEEAPVELPKAERRGFRGLKKWVEDEAFYLSELGVNAVELQPIQEFDTQDRDAYGWGYMPLNYFSPASYYSVDPERGGQIDEFRELVEAFHRRQIAVILDVVYNHLGEPNYLHFIDKQYYFLLDSKGDYLNFSGCGNTLDCNTPMMRRLIVDSLIYLVETFDVDGFRFDLGELVGKETLAIVERALKRVKPSIILVVEPWSFRGHIASELRDTGLSSWNDGYREFMKDYVGGFGSAETLFHFMGASLGSLARFPAQSVNYVESHDDSCWIDKITENPFHDGSFPTVNDRRRTHLMVSILMMSLGMPMLHAGMDMLHSKRGENNTYLRGDLNRLNYDRRIHMSATHGYVRNWIQFRLSSEARCLRLAEAPGEGYFRHFSERNAAALAFNFDFSEAGARFLYAVNPHFEPVTIAMEDMPTTGYRQIADHERFDWGGLPSARTRHDGFKLQLEPLSCALWMF